MIEKRIKDKLEKHGFKLNEAIKDMANMTKQEVKEIMGLSITDIYFLSGKYAIKTARGAYKCSAFDLSDPVSLSVPRAWSKKMSREEMRAAISKALP